MYCIFPCLSERSTCVGDNHCCTPAFPCNAENQGDCDSDQECKAEDGLFCGVDNCVGESFEEGDDCCK